MHFYAEDAHLKGQRFPLVFQVQRETRMEAEGEMREDETNEKQEKMGKWKGLW